MFPFRFGGCLALAAAALTLGAAGAVSAQDLMPEKVLEEAEAAGLSVAFPSEPMRSGQTLGVMPMWITSDFAWKQGPVTHGPGLALSYDWYHSRHFGAGAMLAGEQASGDWPAENSVSVTGSGYVASAFLLYDPFSGNNFGFPILLGASQAYADLKAESPVSVTGGGKTTQNGFGLMIGFSPQFNAWRFRIAPYGALSLAPNPSWCTRGSNNCEYDPGFPYQAIGGGGLSIIWRPLNLGFTYTTATSPGASAYTLKWTKRFGGSPPAPAEVGGKS